MIPTFVANIDIRTLINCRQSDAPAASATTSREAFAILRRMSHIIPTTGRPNRMGRVPLMSEPTAGVRTVGAIPSRVTVGAAKGHRRSGSTMRFQPIGATVASPLGPPMVGHAETDYDTPRL
jgi:hypothetical protein